MFDLFRSRAKAVRYLLGAVLLMVAFSLVVTLIPGYGSGGDAQDQVIAEIGKDALTTREVQMQVQAAMRNREIPSSMLAIYIPQFIDSMITDRALVYQAGRLGLQVSEADVAQFIRSVMPMLYQDGKFVGREAYAAFLAQQNLTIPEFERNAEKQILREKMRSLVAEGVMVSSDEIQQAFRLKNEKVKIDYIAVSPANYRAQVSITPEELQQYWKETGAGYRIPEQRGFQMLIVEESKVAESITLPDAELRGEYEASKDRYRTPERVKVRHVLLKTTGKPPDQIPKIRARAEDLLKQIKGGADFAALARKMSEDTGTAAKGGDLDWVVRGQTVKAFEDAAFSLKPKEISKVIQTEYGFHILQVMEKQDARLKPFEEARNDIAAERKKQLVFDRMQTLSDQVRVELLKAPQQAEQIARQLTVTFANVPKAGAEDPIPQIGASKELMDSLFSLQKGGITPVVQVPGNRLVVAVLNGIFPPRAAQLAEVERTVRERLTQQKAARLVEQRTREAMEKATAGGGDLKKVAQAMGLELKTTPEFNRGGAAEGIGAAAQVGEAFNKNVGAVFGPVIVGEQRFICKVVAKAAADLNKLPAERDDIRVQLKRQKAAERDELFQDGLRAELIRQGKIKIHQKVIDRVVASYRG